MTLEIPTSSPHFVHPLALELEGQFGHSLNDHGRVALQRRSLSADTDFCRALAKSVTTTVQASQAAEMNHLYGYGLTKGAVEHVPTEETYENYVSKVIHEDTVGEGLFWLANRAIDTYRRVHTGSRHIIMQRSPFEAGGVMNNGNLASTGRLDRVIARLPELLRSAGADLADVQSFNRDDPTTEIHHRVWPVELSSDETVAFYMNHQSPKHLTLRRRRPVYDMLFRMIDSDNEEHLLLGEAYKESFALVTPSMFPEEYARRFDDEFEISSIDQILGKTSAVAEVCGEAFRAVIDARDEVTPAVFPTYTCLMLRFNDPYTTASPSSPASPGHQE